MDTVAKNLLKRDERVQLEVDIKHHKFVLCYMCTCIVECNFVMIFIMSLTAASWRKLFVACAIRFTPTFLIIFVNIFLLFTIHRLRQSVVSHADSSPRKDSSPPFIAICSLTTDAVSPIRRLRTDAASQSRRLSRLSSYSSPQN